MKNKFSVSTPSLYNTAKEKNKVDFPYIVEPFLNGVRCYIQKEEDEIMLLTLKHEIITSCPHILSSKTNYNYIRN